MGKMTDSDNTQTTQTPICCARGAIGMPKYDFEGTGTWITAEGRNGREDMEFYVAGGGAPDIASAERIVVVLADVFGLRKGNHRVFCDTLAKKLSAEGEPKTCVVAPDLYRGEPAWRPWFGDRIGNVGVLFSIPAGVYRMKVHYNVENTVDGDILQLVLPFLRSQNPNVDGISMVGFCYGAWAIAKTLEKEKAFVKSAVHIHPAWQIESGVYGNGDANATELAKGCGSTPMLLITVEGDDDLHKPGSEALAILSEARGGIPETDISIVVPKMAHGFVSRDDPAKEDVRVEQEKAMRRSVDFIKKHHSK